MLRHIATAILAQLALTSGLWAQLEPGEVRSSVAHSPEPLALAAPLSVRHFGTSMVGVGDLDGDGIGDLAVGSVADNSRGSVTLMYLSRDGSVKSTLHVDQTHPLLAGTLADGDRFGSGIAPIGDLDGNGVPDLAIGADGKDDAGLNQGALYIAFLKQDPDIQIQSLHKIDGLAGVGDGDRFGVTVAALGDLDGDPAGTCDLAVGASADEVLGTPNSGAVWMLFLNPDGTVLSTTKVSNATGGFEGALTNVDELLGQGLAAVDLDGDGRREVIAGVPGENDGICPEGGVDSGAAFVWFLDSDGTVDHWVKISAGSGADSQVPSGALSQFGSSVSEVGDVDGDGVPDVVVGAPLYSLEIACPFGLLDKRGSCWTLFMNPDGTVKGSQRITANEGSFAGPLPLDTEFGEAVAGLGDLDGDGKVDLAVGARYDDEDWTVSGKVWILFLEGAATQPPFVPFNDALDGRPGRASVVVDSGEDWIGGGTIVVPKTESSFVSAADLLPVDGGEAVAFQPTSGDGLFATGENPTQAAYVSFNTGLDAVPDVLTSNKGDDSVSLLIANTDGMGQFDGTFQDHVDTFASLGGNGAFVGLGIGDFDGDGVDDVIAAGDLGLTLFLADPAGTGALFEHDFVPVADLVDLALGDLDQDGFLDVVTASGAVANPPTEVGEISVVTNDDLNPGDLSVSYTFGAGLAKASVQLALFDGDADPDLLVVTHSYDGGPNGFPDAEIELFLGSTGDQFVPSALTGATFENEQGIHPTFGDVADLDNDGDLDVVYSSSDNIAYDPTDPLLGLDETQPPLELTVLLNQLTQGTTSPLFAAPLAQGTAYSGKGVAPSLQDLFNDPMQGSFVDCVLVFTQDTLAGQDTDGDFTTNVALLIGEGDGTFSDPTPNQFLTGDEPGDGDLGDLDGDLDEARGGGLDVVVPNLGGNSVTVLFTDGQGGVATSTVVSLVDDTLPPMGGAWQGGPRSARLADMDADGGLDIVTYNDWVDLSGAFGEVLASVSLFDGAGGVPVRTQWLPLDRGGELDLGDVTLDGLRDVIATQRRGASMAATDEIVIHPGLPGVLVDAVSPLVLAAPAGHALTGGLLVGDVTLDGAPDLITTSRDTSAQQAHVVVYPNTNTPPASGFGSPVLSPLTLAGAPVDWPGVRSLAVRDVSGDAQVDVVVGRLDGGLVVAEGLGGGSFAASESLNPVAAQIGGGAVRIGDVNGDDRNDIVSSNGSSSDEAGQAFVRALVSQGDGTFLVEQVDGLASTTPDGGALSPLLADMNADGATDVILVHGASGALSILLNDLNGFSVTSPGTAGSTGVVPVLRGLGYSTPGGSVTLELEQAPGGGLVRFLTSGPAALALDGMWSVPTGPTSFTPLGGPLGAPGAGSLTVTATLPVDPDLVGLWVDLVMKVAPPMPGSGPGSPGSPAGSGPPTGTGPGGPSGASAGGVAKRAAPLDLHVSNGLRMEIR